MLFDFHMPAAAFILSHDNNNRNPLLHHWNVGEQYTTRVRERACGGKATRLVISRHCIDWTLTAMAMLSGSL